MRRLRRSYLCTKCTRQVYRMAEAIAHYYRCGCFFKNGSTFLVGNPEDVSEARSEFNDCLAYVNRYALIASKQGIERRSFKAGTCEAIADRFRGLTMSNLPKQVRQYLTARQDRVGRTRQIKFDTDSFALGYAIAA